MSVRYGQTPSRLSTNVSTPRATPKTSFGDRLRAGTAHDYHLKNVLQSLGLSERGALELLSGVAISSPVDRAVMRILQQERMSNFAIQDLMSRYNQSETLASSVQKKTEDSDSGVQQKIG